MKRFLEYVCSDPTYEAWKLTNLKTVTIPHRTFRSYLRGMETPDLLFYNQTFNKRSDPTYEAWKPSWGRSLRSCRVWFRSYLRGMETIRVRQSCGFGYRVPILPTRHGNKQPPKGQIQGHLRSDPTYEAWKHLIPREEQVQQRVFRSYLRGMETRRSQPWRIPVPTFRSYLRGMETEKPE